MDARKVLGRRHSTVFTPPCRAALEASTYREASEDNFRVTGRKLSKQAWGILRKIREVDELVRQDPEARSRIREVHPEVCFWAFAGGKPMAHRKSTRVGWEQRLTLLRRLDSRTDSIFEGAMERFLRREVARDDVLDALVAAIAADGSEPKTLPREPQWDAWGLPMEMVYRHRAQ